MPRSKSTTCWTLLVCLTVLCASIGANTALADAPVMKSVKIVLEGAESGDVSLALRLGDESVKTAPAADGHYYVSTEDSKLILVVQRPGEPSSTVEAILPDDESVTVRLNVGSKSVSSEIVLKQDENRATTESQTAPVTISVAPVTLGTTSSGAPAAKNGGVLQKGQSEPASGPRGGGGPANDNCANAIALSGDVNLAFNTAGATTDGPDEPAACSFFGYSNVGADIWYCWTSECDGTVNISLCGSGYDTKLAVYDGCQCPTAASAIACNDDSCGLQSSLNLTVTPGEQYLIRIGGFNAATGSGVLNISCIGACAECPSVGQPENEPNCGLPTDTVNGGCNSVPPVFTTIACGETFCGTSAFDGATRDTDWYKLVLTQATQVTFGGSAEFDLLIGIVNNFGIDSCAGVTSFLQFATAGACIPAEVSACLPAGTWYLFVAPQFTGTFDCGAAYSVTLSCEDCPPGPGNDDCENAETILCNSTTQGDNTLALSDPSDPFFSCRFGGAGPGVNSIWYKFVATDTSALVDLCNSAQADTLVAVYSGTCGNFTQLACSEDVCGLLSRVCVSNLTVGNTYYIQVASFSAADVGPITLELTCPCPPAPDGENCDNAVALNVPAVVQGSTIGAEPDAPPAFTCVTTVSAPGVWYTVVGDGTTYTATTCSPNSTYDTKLNVYCGTCTQLFCVTGNDDAACQFGGLLSTVTWCTSPGTTYYILVQGFGGATGNFELAVSSNGTSCSTAVPCAPCVVTCPSGGIPENEPNCGLPTDTVNGGCNSVPPVFTNIACGQTYCGTAAFDGSSRDTDWYKIVLTQATQVRWRVVGQFDVLAGIVDNFGIDSCAGVTAFLAFGIGSPCQPVEVAACLPAGTWYLFVAPQFTSTLACGAPYTATATCEDCPPGPDNDDCENAELISCNSTVQGDNTLAIGDPTDPFFSCRFGGPAPGVGSIWYKFVATDTSALADVCSSVASDTLIAIYSGTCGNLVELACGEDECNGLRSRACAQGLTVGNTYYIQVASFDNAGRGPITLELTCPCPAAPPGDLCSDAVGPLAIPSSTLGSTSGMTPDVPPAFTCVTTITAPGVWYTVLGTGTTITATTCSANTSYDTKLNVFCGTCTSLTCITGNDDAACQFSGLHSTVSWCSQPGAIYYILVQGFGGATGNFELILSENGVPCVPSIECLPSGGCCVGGDCFISTEDGCAAAGGDYLGDGSNCAPVGGSTTVYDAVVNQALPDNNPAGVSSTINVPDNFNVQDLDVDLTVNHTWVGDLCVTLTHGATTINLIQRPGAAGACHQGTPFGCGEDNYNNIILDDEGSVAIESACTLNLTSPPNYIPNEALSAFDGQNASGDWTITVSDNASADLGTFVSWSLHFNTGGTSPCVQEPCDSCPPGTTPLTDANGDFSGWCASTSHPNNVTIETLDVDLSQRMVTIAIEKDFKEGPGFGGLIPAILIDFVQVCPNTQTANMILIAGETIHNNTGADWLDFHWRLFDGPEAWFDVAASGFNVGPFTSRFWSRFLDPGTFNQAKDLAAYNGVIANGTTWQVNNPPIAPLKIGVDLSLSSRTSFTLKEVPTLDGQVGAGACCLGLECITLTQADCTAAGGIFKGVGVDCTPTICLPENDECENCTPVQTGVPFVGSSEGSTGTDLSSCAFNDFRDVWHCWTATCTGTATINTCGSLFDTTLSVFSSCTVPTNIVCNDDSAACGAGSVESQVTLPVVAGTTYFIRVSGFNGDSGTYTLNVACTPNIEGRPGRTGPGQVGGVIRN